MKLLLYCTKAKPYLHKTQCIFDNSPIEWQLLGYDHYKKDPYDAVFGTLVCDLDRVNGKIVAECDFEVEEIFEDNLEDARDGYVEHYYTLKSYDDFDEGEDVLLKESCLQKHELSNYLGFENGYAIHIKNLHIFDEPRELSDYKGNSKGNFFKIIEKAPQNMQMVLNEKLEDCILISIRPEWLCKILNGEKTIEVRKKVLKEMK